MWQTLRSIEPVTVAVALFGGYILPTVLLWLLLVSTELLSPSHLKSAAYAVAIIGLWAIFLAPTFAGYLAARLAKAVPLAHGLVVSVGGCVLYLIYLEFTTNLGIYILVVVPLVLLSGFFGAWYCRYRGAR